MVDGLNIVKNYRLTGQESLTMRIRQAEGTGDYSTPEFSIEKNFFRIYSITDVNRTQQNMQQYVIHFLLRLKFFTCQKTTISQTLRGSYSNILLQVLQENAGFKKITKDCI